MPAPIRSETDLAAAISELKLRDPRLIGRLVGRCGAVPLRARPADFGGLAWIVISQQVSTASAEAIHGRVRASFPALDPADFARASEADLKLCGLSAPKIRTLRAIAEAACTGTLAFDDLARMEVGAARDRLMAIKGIGPWTADIFLLFCLGHPDAWPAGDLALQEALRMALKREDRPDRQETEALAERWRPWRGVAASPVPDKHASSWSSCTAMAPMGTT